MCHFVRCRVHTSNNWHISHIWWVFQHIRFLLIFHLTGNMLPYMASYMRNFTDPTVRIEHMMWIPTFQGCFPFAMVIGGLTSNMFSPRTSAFIGCALVTWVSQRLIRQFSNLGRSSVALSAYAIQHSFALFFITYGLLFGLGSGIAYVTAVSTAINVSDDWDLRLLRTLFILYTSKYSECSVGSW